MLFPRERAGPQRLAISAEAELLLVRSTLRSPAAPSGPSPDSPGPFCSGVLVARWGEHAFWHLIRRTCERKR